MRHLLILLLAATPALAAEPAAPQNGPAVVEVQQTRCPDNKPCRVVTLTDQEMTILTGPNGILDTAAKARNLDLGQFVVYFQNKLQASPQGKVDTPTAAAEKDTPK